MEPTVSVGWPRAVGYRKSTPHSTGAEGQAEETEGKVSEACAGRVFPSMEYSPGLVATEKPREDREVLQVTVTS